MVIILLALDNQVKEEENREVDLEEVEEDQRRLRFKKIPDFNDWDCTNFTLYFPWVPGQFSLDQKISVAMQIIPIYRFIFTIILSCISATGRPFFKLTSHISFLSCEVLVLVW